MCALTQTHTHVYAFTHLHARTHVHSLSHTHRHTHHTYTITLQCTSVVDVTGEVDCLLIEGGHLFVGMHKGGEGIIRVWNMSTSAHHQLTGHKVRLCM